MKMIIITYMVLFSSLLLFACSNDTSKLNDTGLETTKDNVTLRCDSLFVLKGWIEKFKIAKPKYTELVDTFKTINAVLKIENNILYLNENNSIILSACVKLIKGSKNHEFHGYVHRAQFNQQNDDNVKTFTIVSIDCATKKSGGMTQDIKEYTLYSDGKIEKLEPTDKKTYYK